MSPLRRAASALLALGFALGAFTASPAPVRAEESGAGLSATVFAFDFSGSIFCYANGAPDASCKNPINKALSEAVGALADEISLNAKKYTEREFDFLVTRFGSASRGSVSVCKGNTSTETALLISCLKEVASLYLKPSSQLGGTAFTPELELLDGYSGQRCGLIIFTDGTPEDKSEAEAIASTSDCAILPVATGPGDIDQEYLRDITSTELETIAGCSDQPFEWPEVYFDTAQDAAIAIRTALNKVACLQPIPAPACMTVAEYKTALENLGFIVSIGSGVDATRFPAISGINPVPGTPVVNGSEIVISGASEALPAQCAQTPPPTEPPPPPPPPTPPCVADGPLSWLGCNPWILLVLLGLILSRLWWIARDLQVSLNGQEAIALRGGTLVGFDVHGGTASRVSNAGQAEVKISRSFFRFLPSTRISAASLEGTSITGAEKFNIGKPVELTSQLTARIAYGNPRQVTYSGSSDDGPTDFSDTSSSSSGGSVSSAL
jgi:hypothetical protein